jgi:Predicted transporter (DUF2162).
MHDFKHIEMLGLFLGLMLSTGMFAVKAAVGGWHCLALHGERRPWLPIIFLVPYLILFEFAFWLLSSIGMDRLSEFSLRYFGLGVLLHLLMCVGLVIWGYRLLIREDTCKHGDRSWMLLAFPCPVCASAILLACVMAQLLYPTASGLLRHGLPLAFAVLYLGTFASLWAIRRFTGVTALHLAGWMMLLIAAYFVLLLMISPQWTQLDRIHALASHSIPPNLNTARLWTILAIGLVTFLCGMWHGHRKHQ